LIDLMSLMSLQPDSGGSDPKVMSTEAVPPAEKHAAGGPKQEDGGVVAGGLSKRAMKRMAKRQHWLDTKAERRAAEKVKKKAKVARLREENKISGTYTEFRKRVKQDGSKVKCDLKVAFDMSLGHHMNQRDAGKTVKQVLRSYSHNRRLDRPLHLYMTGLTGQCETEMGRHNGYQNWDFAGISPLPLTEVFKDHKVVYLTSESDNVLGESLSPECVYVIGGLVDHNSQKGLCHRLALEMGIDHARFPIEENIDLKTRKVLTIDHVFAVMAAVGSQGKTWKEALMEILPKRKGAADKAASDDADNQDQASSCDNDEIGEVSEDS